MNDSEIKKLCTARGVSNYSFTSRFKTVLTIEFTVTVVFEVSYYNTTFRSG